MVEKSAAALTIHRAGDMTEKGRKDIAKWLRRQARFLEQDGEVYSSRFTARYLYTEKEMSDA